MEYSNIGAVLFDLDGTLIEHTRDISAICHDTFDAFADELAPITQEIFWETFWSKNHDMWYMMVDGVLVGDTARLYSFANTLRELKADGRLAQHMLQDWEDRIIATSRVFDETLPVIEHLRAAGIRLGIVTNGYTTMQTRKIHYHNLENQVEFVLISEAAGVHKPDKRIFDMALERLGMAAHQALFVGDTPTTDVEGARNAGLQSVLIDPGDTWKETASIQPSKIRRLSELLPLLGLTSDGDRASLSE